MCVDVCVWVCVYAAGAIALFAWAGRVIERSGFRVDTWVPYAFCFFTPYGACAQSIVVCIVLRCLSYWLRSACVTFNTKLIHRRSNLLNSRRPKTYSARVHTCVLACALVDCMRSWPLSSSFEPGSSVLDEHGPQATGLLCCGALPHERYKTQMNSERSFWTFVLLGPLGETVYSIYIYICMYICI